MAKIINSQEFDNTIESGVVVVDFFATWCGPCKMLAPVIDELSGELENVNFVKVDIDQSMDLAQKFKIVSVPTLKVFKNGEEVDTLMGFMPKEVLKSKVEAHI
ncbi:MAG: Thioredoxin [Intestinibacter bartlettii DORA_8_9]|nr:MAG: Thioredoxin [Intestinibacter bartlettii DORA_8_9]